MPSNPKQTLGYIALQLKAQKQAADQAAKRQSDLQAQQNAQQDKELSVKSIDSAFKNYNEGENRKLQLAGLMSKSAESNAVRRAIAEQGNATRIQIEGMKEGAAKPLNDAKTGKAVAETANIPAEHLRKEAADKATHEDRVRGQDMGVVKEYAKPAAFDGKRGLELDPEGSIGKLGSSIGLKPAAPTPEGSINVGKKGREAAVKDLDAIEQELTDSEDALKEVRGADKKFFNPVAGGTDLTVPNNKLTNLLGVADKSVHIGGNSWKDLEANFDKLGPFEKAQVSQRRSAGQAIGRLLQTYRHRMTGAQFTDKESAGYNETLTGFDAANPFVNDQALLLDALERTHAHTKRRAGLLAQIAKTGMRPDLSLTNDELQHQIGAPSNETPHAPVKGNPGTPAAVPTGGGVLHSIIGSTSHGAEAPPQPVHPAQVRGPNLQQLLQQPENDGLRQLGVNNPGVQRDLQDFLRGLPTDMRPDQKASQALQYLRQMFAKQHPQQPTNPQEIPF